MALVGTGAASASADSNSVNGVLSCPDGQQVRIWSNVSAALAGSVTHYFSTEAPGGGFGSDKWEVKPGVSLVNNYTFTLENDTVYWRVLVEGSDPRFTANAKCYPA